MANALDDIGIDFDNVSADDIERQIELGGKVPAGLWHAALTGAGETQTTKDGTPFRELTFHVLAGPGKGMDIKDKLFLTEKTKNRQMVFASRLGLLKKENGKYARIPGKSDYADVIGAQCVIEVEHKKGDKGTFANLSFEGVLHLDDKRCANVPKAGQATAAAMVAAAPKVTANSELDGL